MKWDLTSRHALERKPDYITIDPIPADPRELRPSYTKSLSDGTAGGI